MGKSGKRYKAKTLKRRELRQKKRGDQPEQRDRDRERRRAA